MSEITETHTAWVPPPFPPQGRLPGRALQVGQNCHQQNSDERRYHQELCLAAGRRVEPPCCKTLHISLFFDGTGNNLNHDFFIAGNDSNLLIVFYVQIMPDDFVMQLHRF